MLDPTEKEKLNRIFKELERRIERLEEEIENLKKTVASIDRMLTEQSNQRIRAMGARPQA